MRSVKLKYDLFVPGNGKFLGLDLKKKSSKANSNLNNSRPSHVSCYRISQRILPIAILVANKMRSTDNQGRSKVILQRAKRIEIVCKSERIRYQGSRRTSGEKKSLTSKLRERTKSKNPLEHSVKGQNKHFLNG